MVLIIQKFLKVRGLLQIIQICVLFEDFYAVQYKYTFSDFLVPACYINVINVYEDFFFVFCSHLAQGTPAKITAAASQITKKINIIVIVYRDIQVFIAREVNKTSIMLLYSF